MRTELRRSGMFLCRPSGAPIGIHRPAAINIWLLWSRSKGYSDSLLVLICRSGPYLLQQVLLDEQDRRVILVIDVVLLAEAVPLVVRHQEPHGRVVLACGGGYLLGLGVRHARVVLALDHEQRLGDLARVGERRDLFEELGHFGVSFVAVLDAAQVASVGLEIGRAHV